MFRRKKLECVYCGEIGALTRDHVPPRALFAEHAPNNLITVPSCARCNNGASKDDEQFRLAFAVREDTKGNPERDSAFQAVLRSLERPEAAKFAETISSRISTVPKITPAGLHITPAGLHIGRRLKYSAPGSPLDRVMIRVTKGLFYHLHGRRLPDDHHVNALYLPRLYELTPPERQDYEELVSNLLQAEPTRFGTGFTYWQMRSSFTWARSFWLFEFYGQIQYLCMTFPNEAPNPFGPPPVSTEDHSRANILDPDLGINLSPTFPWDLRRKKSG